MLNKIDIQGRLTADPELRVTSTGKSVASFSLACERDYAAEGAKRETDFIEVVAWGKTAEFIVRNFFKGQLAIVSGRIQVRPWEDKGGQKRRTTEIVADNVYFCGGKKDGAEGSQVAYPANTDKSYPVLVDEDETLPF